MIRAKGAPNGTDYYIFKEGIKPMWEDPANEQGGNWSIRAKKVISSRYWEQLMFALIGEQFDPCSEVCGASISVRYQEDVISLWVRTAENEDAVQRIRDKLKALLEVR